MEAQAPDKGADCPEALTDSRDLTTEDLHNSPREQGEEEEEEEGGIPIPTSGLLQVTERRQPLSSVSSLEVHFDLLDLTELTDMSDQELAEVFADSDEENSHNEPGAVLHQPPVPRGGYLRSPSWTRTKGEMGREKKHLSDLDRQPEGVVESFVTVKKPEEH
uniref:Dysbindin domain-containing protein 1 n=2 Tax=Latimeria chalumnae TaxID=7897 RepID=H3A5A6_LATCH